MNNKTFNERLDYIQTILVGATVLSTKHKHAVDVKKEVERSKASLIALVDEVQDDKCLKLLKDLSDSGEIHHSVYDYRTEEIEEHKAK